MMAGDPEHPEKIQLSFSNVGNSKLEIFWVDFKANEKPFGHIIAKKNTILNTFAGHAWRVKHMQTNQVVFEIVVPSGKENVEYHVGRGCTDDSDTVLNAIRDSRHHSSIEEEDVTEPKVTWEDKSLEEQDDMANFYAVDAFDKILIPNSDQIMEKDLQNTACPDVREWLSRVLITYGYHVLCVESVPDGSSMEIDAWRNGYQHIHESHRQTFVGSTMSELRKHLESVLDIYRTDDWRHAASVRQNQRAGKEGKKEYLPQPWRMFDRHGHRIMSLGQIASQTPALVLVFEGGQFIYPGVEVGYERVLTVADKEIFMETLSLRPLVFSIQNFLEPDECEKIIEVSEPHMAKSEVSLMDKDVGKEAKEFRTSSTYFLDSARDPVLPVLDRRVANLTRTAVNQQEFLQVLKYEKGEYYSKHTDFWDPVEYTDSEVVEKTHRGHVNRLVTVFWYMTDVEGGYTAFPDAPLNRLLISPTLQEVSKTDDPSCPHIFKVRPEAGKVIMFYSLLPDGDGDNLSAHEACPVTEGVKWAANKWIWNAYQPHLT